MRPWTWLALMAGVACGSKSPSEPTPPTTTDTATAPTTPTVTTDTTTPRPTGDTAVSTVATASTADTGPAVCEVVARDGSLRDCTDLVVFCDVSPENSDNLDHCTECLGGFVAFYETFSDLLGTDDFYADCQFVPLPDREETCSVYLDDPAEGGVEPFVPASAARVGQDGTVDCFWAHEIDRYGNGPLPVTVATDAEMQPLLYCLDSVSGDRVDAPQGVLDLFELTTHRAYVYDAESRLWLGRYGTELVFDEGCGGVSGVPPQIEVEALLIDATLPTLTEATCRLFDCPAEVRDAPVPP